MNINFQIIVLMLFGFQATCMSGQVVSTTKNQTAELDQSITYGKLDNGLSYYIKHLPDSQDEVNLRFYVLAGANHQDPDQLNIAHFVEHMAFKSSKHFPNGIHRELLENNSIGMSQRDINATAVSSHTRYMFDVPVNNEEAMKVGLLWFKDIATGLHFKTEEIDSERGVLVQELIQKTGNDIPNAIIRNRLKVQLVPCRQNYSNYIDHHKTVDSQRLKQFYSDWYRPDLMAIVIVGKIDDVVTLEKQITAQFADIPIKEKPREIPNCDSLFFNQSPQFALVGKEFDSLKNDEKMELELLFRDRKTTELISKKAGLKRINKTGLLVNVINNRLRETTKVYNNFFDIHMTSIMAPSSFKVLITARNNREKEGVQTLARILQQIRKHGILDSEFKEVKEERLAELERIGSNNSKYWLGEIRNNIVYNEALPNDKREYIKNWLSLYEKNELEDFVREIDLEMPEDIGILAPANHPALSYTEEEIRALIREVEEETILSYVLPEAPTNLMLSSQVNKLQAVSYEDKGIGPSGAREIFLENGVNVILKPLKTSTNDDRRRIVLHGFKDTGALNFATDDYFSAVNAPWIIKNSGVGKFNKFDLQRYTSANSLGYQAINLYVNNQESGIKIGADLVDLEEMLQLVYLFLSQPRVDIIAFQDWKVQQSKYYHDQLFGFEQINLNNNIDKIIGDNSGVSQGTERYLGLEETDMEKGIEIYREIFGNSRGFSFILTGDFAIDSVAPLINKYLGNLPYQADMIKIPKISTFSPNPTGPVLVQFKSADTSNKTNYTYRPTYIVPTEDQENWKEKLIARALGDVVGIKVRGLRFEKGYSLYSMSGFSNYNVEMKQHEFEVNFNCTPEEYPLLRDEFANIITELKTELVSEEVLEQGLKVMRSVDNPSGKGNPRYRFEQKLYEHYRFGLPWVEHKQVLAYIKSLTPEDILKAAQKYFKSKYLYEFVMIN